MLTIFGLSSGCPNCEKAKNLIKMYGYPASEWEYIELDTPDGSLYLAGVKADGFRGAPAVYKDGDVVGGVNELQKYLLEWRKSA